LLYLRHIAIFGMTNSVINSSRSNREKVLVVITVSVALSAAIFIVVIEPQLKEHKARSMRMNQLSLKLTKMKGDLLVKDRIDSVYAQIEPLIASSGTDQQEISLFTRELSDLYSKRNIKTRTIKILPLTDEEFYRRLSIRIEMSGHIREILNFVASIETHPNPIRIEQFDIKSREIVDNVEASFVITKVVAKPEKKVS
jgi:Tfp pilus assembly protein PilO